MTIEVTQMWSRAGATSESEDGQKFAASFISFYQVTHEADDTRADIFDHEDMPQQGDLFSEGGASLPGIFCKRRSLERRSPIYSVVTVEWSGEYGPTGFTDDPLNKEPEIVRTNRLVSAEVDQDFYGRPITNSVGDPVKGVVTDVSDFSISITRNYATIDIFAIRAYLRSHNSDDFDGWPAGTARFRTYTAKEIKYNDSSYHEVTAVVEFREPYNTAPARAWFARYRNEGLRERIGVNITFSGGGGSGAAGYAITSGGAITKIVVTNRGTGYTSAPTVTITSADGTGASATAVLTDDEVTSVTVNAGGSDYRVKLVNCVDDQGNDVTTPVLLAADGSRLDDASAAVWIERPLSGPLPYADLGLLDE